MGVPLEKHPQKPCVCRMHTPCESPAATANDTSPEMPLAAATVSSSRIMDEPGNAPAARSLDWHWSVMRPNEPLRTIALNDRSVHRHTANIASQPFRCGSLDCTTGIRRFSCGPRSTRHHPNWPRCFRRAVFRDETPRKTRSPRTRTKKYANGPRLPCRSTARTPSMVETMPEPGFYSGPTPRLQRFAVRPRSFTRVTKHGHRRPDRPLKSFLR